MARMQAHATGSGRPMALVGGGVTGWKSWEPHQALLAGSRRVTRLQPLAVQLGLENRPLPADYSVALEARALAAALDPEPVDLVAWSYGAFIALDFALGAPERVRTLTLIEPPAFWVLDATGAGDDRPPWPSWLEHRRSLRTGDASWLHRDSVERLRTFDRPTLLVTGTGTTHVLRRIIDGLASALPRAALLELPGGHAPQMVAMDAFLTRLREHAS